MASPEIPPFPKRGDYAQNRRGDGDYQKAVQDWQVVWGPVVKAQAASSGREAALAGDNAEEEARRKKALRDHMNSPTGQNLQLAGNATFLTAAPSVGVNYLIGKTAPAGTPLGGRFARLLPYLAEAGAEYGAARELGSNQPSALDNPYGHDSNQIFQNALYGMTAGPVVAGMHKAFGTAGQSAPSTNALLPQPAPVSSAPSPAPEPAPESPRYRGPYRDVTREMAGDMGLKVAGKEAKGATLTRALAHVDNMNADMLRNVAAKIPEIGAGASTAEIRTGVKDLLSRLGKGSGSLPAILAALGIGGAVLGADQAEANPYAAPGEDTLTVPPSRGQRIIGGLGRIGDAAREVPGQLAEMAPSIAAHTVGLPAGLAYDAGSSGLAGSAFEEALKPYSQRRDEYVQAANLQNAQSEDARQVAEMRQQQFAAQPRQFPEQQPPIDPASVPPTLQRFVNPGGQTPLGQPGGDPMQGMRPEGPQEAVQPQNAAPPPMDQPQDNGGMAQDEGLSTQGMLDRVRARTAGGQGRAEFEHALEELAQAFKAHHAAVADHAASRHPQSQNALAR